MEKKSVVIIGAGIAGLSAGCYLGMNGYKVKIFEMHDKPGGLCTAWTRNGYTFDGSCHWVVGSNPKSGFNTFWRELGIAKAFRFVEHDEFGRFELGGKTFIIYSDLDRLEKHMLELAPEDSLVIKDFIHSTRLLTRMELPAGTNPLEWLWAGILILPCLKVFNKYGRMSVREFAGKFKSPFFREIFNTLFDSMPDCPSIMLMMPVAWMSKKDAGHPIGGSLKFARVIENRLAGLGGSIEYKAPVEKILTVNNSACGVRLKDGREERADIVISAADGRTTVFDMLEGKYMDDTIRGYYCKDLMVWPGVMQVSLGVARDFKGEPHSVTWRLEKPVSIGGIETKWMGVINYYIDPEMAPPGKTCLVSIMDCNYDFWKELSKTPARYEEEKKRTIGIVIDEINKRYPGIKDQVEAEDLATPVTYERYTGNQRGATQGWCMTTKTIGITFGKGMSKTLPGLDNFYMVGQWVQPGGGIPTGGMLGRQIAQTICKKDKKKFITTSVTTN